MKWIECKDMIPQQNFLSTEKSTLSKKNYYKWEEAVNPTRISYLGKAYNSVITRDDTRKLISKCNNLSCDEKNLLRLLMDHQNDHTGQLNISNKYLAEDFGKSEKTIERIFKGLFTKYPEYIQSVLYRPIPFIQRRQINFDSFSFLSTFCPKDIFYNILKKLPKNVMIPDTLMSEGSDTLSSEGRTLKNLNIKDFSSLVLKKKEDILYSENFDKGVIKSGLTPTLNSPQSLFKTEEKKDNPPSIKSEELPSTKIKEDTPRMDKDRESEESSTNEGPPPQSGDNVTTLKKSFFVDGKKEMLNNRRKDPMGAFATHIQLHSIGFEEKEEGIKFEPITSSTIEVSDDFIRAKSIEELPEDIKEYLKTLSEEKRQSLIEESNLLPIFFRSLKDFPYKLKNNTRRQEPVKIEDWKQKHYDKLEQIAKERERIEKEQKANRGLTKEELRCYRINNIKEIYKNWKEVLERENCDLEEIQYRMRKNPLYEPFTKDTSNWNSECHPEYGFMNEDEKDFEFRRCVDIWMWPKPFKHSERNVKMFKKARIRADKLKITYYEWVAAIYDRIGELKIEYTHINCSFAEELIEKWIEDGSNPPQNFGHRKRQNWLMYNQKGVKRKKYQPRKTMEQEIDEVREMLL